MSLINPVLATASSSFMTVNQYAYTQRLTRVKDPVRNYSSSDRILAGKAYLQDIVDPRF